ncbi:MAG TPA: hypothetical protein VFW92_02680 [Candidatus Limnocylindrales bacterium]|nr:hypothetical protein [Candidatus Limnocylindrales bacterium]
MIFAILASAIVALIAIVEIARLQAAAPPTRCLVDFIGGGAVLPEGCPPIDQFQGLSYGEAARVTAAMAVVPALVGITLTSGVISGEVEHRTAQLAWILAPSRGRWLVDRMLLPIGVALLTSVLLAVLSQRLEAARFPYLAPDSSFMDYGLHGPIIVVRTIAYASLGLLAGAVTGRQLPSLLTSGICALLLFGVLTVAMPFGQPQSPVTDDDASRADLVASTRYRTSDGLLLTYDEARAQAPAGMTADETVVWMANTFVYVPFGVPEEELPFVEVRESLLLLGVATAAVGATWIVITRRSPY